jgi:hypothetical protein
LGALLRGITRVNQFDQDTCNQGLVLDKLSKLIERPRLVSAPLAMPNRTTADALQVFKGNLAMRVFSLSHLSL